MRKRKHTALAAQRDSNIHFLDFDFPFNPLPNSIMTPINVNNLASALIKPLDPPPPPPNPCRVRGEHAVNRSKRNWAGLWFDLVRADIDAIY